MADSQEGEGLREDLEQLLASPGWQWFIKLAEDEWIGPAAYKKRVQHAVKSVPMSGDAETVARSRVVQTEAVIEAVESLLREPHQMLQRLKFGDAQKIANVSDTWRGQRRTP